MRSSSSNGNSKLKLLKSAGIYAAAICLIAPMATQDSSRADAQQKKFDREQTMLMNLKNGVGSTGFHIIESNRRAKDIIRDLGKAMFQLQEVDKAYSKSRGKPDSRSMDGTKLKLVNAQNTAQKLSDELWDTFQDLKKSINTTLVLDEVDSK